ncbi:MAG: trehalose-phosphatase [Spirochaetota bacterium]
MNRIMTEYLFTSDALNKVIESLRIKPRILAFDFDGTLVPIADSPAGVVLPVKLPYLLKNLSGDKDTVVSVISGRSVPELERIIGIPSIIYFGNHGITSSIEEFAASKADLQKWSQEAFKIYQNLSYLEQKYNGCLIENKGPVVSVHYRKVDAAIIESLLFEVGKIVSAFDFKIQSGKMVYELKPMTGFSKGTALLKLATSSFAGWRRGDPFLFAGDDFTDEDGFKVIKDFGVKAYGLKIGDGETTADYRLYDGEILKLIEMILQEEL